MLEKKPYLHAGIWIIIAAIIPLAANSVAFANLTTIGTAIDATEGVPQLLWSLTTMAGDWVLGTLLALLVTLLVWRAAWNHPHNGFLRHLMWIVPFALVPIGIIIMNIAIRTPPPWQSSAENAEDAMFQAGFTWMGLLTAGFLLGIIGAIRAGRRKRLVAMRSVPGPQPFVVQGHGAPAAVPPQPVANPAGGQPTAFPVAGSPGVPHQEFVVPPAAFAPHTAVAQPPAAQPPTFGPVPTAAPQPTASASGQVAPHAQSGEAAEWKTSWHAAQTAASAHDYQGALPVLHPEGVGLAAGESAIFDGPLDVATADGPFDDLRRGLYFGSPDVVVSPTAAHALPEARSDAGTAAASRWGAATPTRVVVTSARILLQTPSGTQSHLWSTLSAFEPVPDAWFIALSFTTGESVLLSGQPAPYLAVLMQGMFRDGGVASVPGFEAVAGRS